MKRYLILSDESLILSELDPQNLTLAGLPKRPSASSDEPGDLKSLVRGLKDEAEMEAISRTLEQTNWNRKEAARLLNISYKALLYKIRQYGIEPQDHDPHSRLRNVA